jgi:hypothetical protein
MEAEPQLEAGSSDDEGPDGGQWVDAGSRGSPRDDSLVVTWQLHVKSDDGVTTIEIEPDASCVEAKERIARIEGTPAELMRLSLSMPGPGNVPLVELNDMFSLSECGVKDGSVDRLRRPLRATPSGLQRRWGAPVRGGRCAVAFARRRRQPHPGARA